VCRPNEIGGKRSPPFATGSGRSGETSVRRTHPSLRQFPPVQCAAVDTVDNKPHPVMLRRVVLGLQDTRSASSVTCGGRIGSSSEFLYWILISQLLSFAAGIGFGVGLGDPDPLA
jgi:hypothetical protein